MLILGVQGRNINGKYLEINNTTWDIIQLIKDSGGECIITQSSELYIPHDVRRNPALLVLYQQWVDLTLETMAYFQQEEVKNLPLNMLNGYDIIVQLREEHDCENDNIITEITRMVK